MGKWQESDTLVSRYGKTSIPEKRVGEPRIFKEEPALLQKNFKSYAGECFLEAWSRNLDSLGTVGLSSERKTSNIFYATSAQAYFGSTQAKTSRPSQWWTFGTKHTLTENQRVNKLCLMDWEMAI